MILSDFRYQDPWSEEKFTLPDFVRQGQAQQRYDQQEEINRKTLDKTREQEYFKAMAII